MTLAPNALRRIVEAALEEDLARGDVTTAALVDPDSPGAARVVAREELIFCGTPVVREVFRQVDDRVQVQALCDEGQALAAGDAAVRLQGPAAAILAGERTALNFVQRMSAVAGLTRTHVEQLPRESRARITDTRKTTPGLRALQRYAVRCGGGHNHREDLGAAVLIKDNHIAACGDVGEAIVRARAHAPHTCRITCEVDNHEQLDQALSAGADVVMLDNFADAELAAAVEQVAGRALVEVSGNVTPQRVATIAAAGVDVISVGALTHAAGSVDLGLDWESA